jgi:HEAT repeat protein
MAARALRTFPAESALVLPVLREAVKDPDPDVRRVAEESVKQVTKHEVERLTALLKDRNEDVRVLAAKAIGRMGAAAADALPALKKAAEEDADADVRSVANNAMQKIKGAPAKP